MNVSRKKKNISISKYVKIRGLIFQSPTIFPTFNVKETAARSFA